MFSVQEHDDFDREASWYEDSLLDIAARSGYSVYWIDNGNGCKGVCSRVSNRDVHVSLGEMAACPDSECFDEILVEELDAQLASVEGDTLIVLHQLGSHGPAYFRRYPDKFAVFAPECRSANFGDCTQTEITNSYDNTIVYTDHVISGAIDVLKAHAGEINASLIYMSDHGESLGESNMYLHGMPFKLAPLEQTRIPMIYWSASGTGVGGQSASMCARGAATTRPISHDNLFHTELGLLEIETAVYKPELDLFSTCESDTAIAVVSANTNG
jgi:lipid A ethanolaminephosphotransferase